MRYESGTSGNPNGRPKGSKNKPVQVKVEALLKRTLNLIEKDIDAATPEQRQGFIVGVSAAIPITQMKDYNETGS